MNTHILETMLNNTVEWAEENIGAGKYHHQTILEKGCGWKYHGQTSDNAMLALLRNRLKKVGIVECGTDRFGRVWFGRK
jgi:hypothetical protein